MLRITLPPMSDDERARGVRGRAIHRTTNVEVLEVEVEGGRIEAVSATYEDRPPYRSIEVQASGSSLVFETMGEWVAWNYDWDRIWKSDSPDNERNLRALAERMLSVLMVIEEHLPAIHLPPASFEDLSEGQMRLVESELPAATTPALERFAPGIFKSNRCADHTLTG